MIKIDKKQPCPRCGGLGTIPTPDSKHNEVCPICGGTGKQTPMDPQYDKKWIA